MSVDKKILLFIDSISSGGAQRQIVGLAGLLKEKGYEVKVATYYNIPFYAAYLEKRKIEYQTITGASNIFQRIFKVRKYINQEKPDVVISYLNIPSILACICKMLGGKWKLIVSERNTTQKLSKQERVKYFLYRWADVIVPNSFSQEKFIIKHYPRLLHKVKVITNFVNTDSFSPSTDNFKVNDVFEIICVGRINKQKNILRFLDAVAKVRDKGHLFHISWYGHAFPEYFNECKAKIESLHLESVFDFKQPDNNIGDRYREAEVFCLPSIYEGFPNVLCEAMSCGLPVLCSDVCDNPNIVQEGKNGFLFNPYDVDAMSAAIEKMLLISNEERMKMSTVSRELSINLFSSERFIRKYLDVIEAR